MAFYETFFSTKIPKNQTTCPFISSVSYNAFTRGHLNHSPDRILDRYYAQWNGNMRVCFIQQVKHVSIHIVTKILTFLHKLEVSTVRRAPLRSNIDNSS